MTRDEAEALFTYLRTYHEVYVPKQTYVNALMAEFANVPKSYIEGAVDIYQKYWSKYKKSAPTISDIKDCLWRVKLLAISNMLGTKNEEIRKKNKVVVDCLEKCLGGYNKEYEVNYEENSNDSAGSDSKWNSTAEEDSSEQWNDSLLSLKEFAENESDI